MKTTHAKSEYDLNVMPYNRHLRYPDRYYGLVVDVNDKSGSGAVKVYIPELMKGLPHTVGIWAVRLFQVEGMKSTIWYNQWVVIEFKEGNPNFPLVVGSIKHFDLSPPCVNPKTWKWPDPNQRPDDVQFIDKKYAGTYRKTDMDKRDTRLGSESHVLFQSPRLGHRIRSNDDEKYSFIEHKTQHKNTYTLCDTFDYALIHVIATDHPKNNKYSQELMLSGLHQYSEMMSSSYWGIRGDGKQKYTIVRSKKNLLFLHDDLTTAFIVSGQSKGAKMGNVPDIIWKHPMDRWAPVTKVRTQSMAWGMSQMQAFWGKTVNGTAYNGSSKVQLSFNGQATYMSLSSGYIYLNSY